MPRKRAKRLASQVVHAVGVAGAFVVALLLVIPLTFDDGAHQRLNRGASAWRAAGNLVAGFDLTAPRQNLFSLVRDITQTLTIVDHDTVYTSRMLGVTNFFSRGALATVADAFRWFNIPLTRKQAYALRLCRPLDQLHPGEQLVVQADPIEYGIASWYGPGFHGRLAASGEIYNMYDRTAAHKSLPLQSLVRVVSQRSNRSIVVRINDRGPYVGGRIIDLSNRAKQELGAGDLAAVYLERIDPGALDVYCE